DIRRGYGICGADRIAGGRRQNHDPRVRAGHDCRWPDDAWNEKKVAGSVAEPCRLIRPCKSCPARYSLGSIADGYGPAGTVRKCASSIGVCRRSEPATVSCGWYHNSEAGEI